MLSCVRDIFWQAFWHGLYFRNQRLASLYSRNITVAEFLKKPSLEGKLFCYKEPFLCFAAEHFAAHFPNAKFIHIVRDGRDNTDSMVRTYGDALSDAVLVSEQLSYNKVSEIGTWRRVNGFNYPWWLPVSEEESFRGMSKYARYVRLWKEMTIRCRSLGALASQKRYLEIKYEDFVKQPVSFGHQIRQFLDQPDSKKFNKRLNKAFTRSTNLSRKNQSIDRLEESMAIAGDLLDELDTWAISRNER